MKNFKLKIITCLVLVVSDLILGTTGFWYSNLRKYVDNSFSLNGNKNVTIGYGQVYNDEGYLIDLSDDKKAIVKVDNNVDTSKLGNYTVTYTLSYLNYSKSITRTVNVIDKEEPKLNIDCNDKIYVAVNSIFNGCNYNVSDNHDSKEKINIKIKSNVNTSKVGDYTINYSATDTSGNTSHKEIKVLVRNKKDLNYIKISIKNQKLEYYENGILYLSTPITSGRYNATPKGKYKILNKVKNTTLKGKNYVSFVRYWMAFKGNSFGIHDASWRNNFGNMNYYHNGSHGCVNTPIKAMETLYNRVEVGTPVYITD